jgi:plasmid stabilization system protein ParE
MKYQVIVTHTEMDHIEEMYQWLDKKSTIAAARWYYQMMRTIDALEIAPKRWPTAPEGEAFGLPIRQRLTGKRQGTHRILFLVQRNSVFVLHVLHGARRYLDLDQLLDSFPPINPDDFV